MRVSLGEVGYGGFKLYLFKCYIVGSPGARNLTFNYIKLLWENLHDKFRDFAPGAGNDKRPLQTFKTSLDYIF